MRSKTFVRRNCLFLNELKIRFMRKLTLITKVTKFKTTRIFLFVAISITGFLTSCTAKPAVVKGNKMMKVENLALGKTIYENSCAKCHDLPNPTDHSAQDWVGIMNRMAPKAKLSEDQREMVYDYIVSAQK